MAILSGSVSLPGLSDIAGRLGAPAKASLAVGLVTVAALTAGWIAGGDTGSAAKLAPGRQSWTMPTPRVIDANKDLAVLKERKPWGIATGSQPGQQASNQPTSSGPVVRKQVQGQTVEWRLTGLVTQTKIPVALITTKISDGKYKTELRKVGDKLPDGSILDNISADGIEVSDEGQRATIRLFWPRT